MSRTDYIARVRKGIEVYEALAALAEGEELIISFGNRGEYAIRAYDTKYPTRTERSYSIGERNAIFGRRMNIDNEKSGKSYLYCYSFDLFDNKTIAKLYFEHITIIGKETE